MYHAHDGWGQHFFYSLLSGIIYTIYVDGNSLCLRLPGLLLVPYSAEQMYQLVNDVQSHIPVFARCVGSRVPESSPAQMTAAVDVEGGYQQDVYDA